MRMARYAVVVVSYLVLGVAQSGCAVSEKPFPPEDIDHLQMTVSVDVEIAGIGKDTIKLEGTVSVHRSGPIGEGGREMTGTLVGASLSGKSEVFGEVHAVQRPDAESTCQYRYAGPGQYPGSFDIHGWFWLPAHKRLYMTTSAVKVAGEAKAIPPVGQVAKITEDEVPLRDITSEAGQDVGFVSNVRGEVHGLVRIGG